MQHIQFIYNDFEYINTQITKNKQKMIQSRQLADSQSQDFAPNKHKNKKISDYDQNQSDIPNDNSFDAQQSQGLSSNESDQQQQSNNITKQQQFQRQILKKAIEGEQTRKPFQREIMGDIIDKLKNIEDVARDKVGEQLIGLRIQELVYSKLLVLTHGCSQFRIVLSHFHLGYAYLRHDCIEQAIQHISIAIHKNQRLFEQLPKCKIFNCIMQNILAECLIKKQEYDDAIQVLDQAILLAEKDKLDTEQISNRAKVLLAQCYSRHRQYDQSIRIIDEVLAKTKGKPDSQQNYAFTLVQKATILASKGDYNDAITSQDQAINILIKINYPKPEDVAEMYGKLADYFEKTGNPESSLQCIQKLKTLYQQLYSPKDKRVIKARRRIATSLLKNDRFKQAVDELLEIIKLEAEAFGESSLQIARTLKLLGTVCIRLGQGDARTHLKRAMNIFNAHGNKKQVDEIKQKLKILMQSSGNNNDMKILSEQDL